MLSVYQLIIPTPYKVGPVNVYVIKNHPVTLVDAGADSPEAYQKLCNMLQLLGVHIGDIERVVLTHSHPDHSGLAAKIAAESGAAVLAHDREIKKLTNMDEYLLAWIPSVAETGVSTDMLQNILGERDKLPRPMLPDANVSRIDEGDLMEFDTGELRVLHLPGHSPGHLCLYQPEQKFFFSGDFMLPHITPNPLMEPDLVRPGRRLPALSQYLEGLERVEKMDISVVFPGHGGCFSDCIGVIEKAREHHRHQVGLIREKLGIRELNTFQLCREIYPTLEGWDIFLGLSEIQAHLDLMIEQKQIGSYQRDGVAYYLVMS